MFFTELRRSERIRNRNVPAHDPMLHQTEKEGARVPASVQSKRKNNIQRHKRHTSPFSKLPDVLVMEILSRLPPKSFFRCKSVCKTWLSLSSDASRLNKHLQPTMTGFFYNHVFDVSFVNLSCDINKVEVDGTMSALSCLNYRKILDCCNGLLIVGAFKKLARFAHDLHVYNPATRTLFTLWHRIQQNHDIWYEVFSLAFDPQVFHQFHVIKFTGELDSKVIVDIFSYERRICKHHKMLVLDVRINMYSKGTFVDGRVHRLTTQDEILSIDPINCSYQIIRPPNLENRDLIEIGQSCGVLHYLSLCSDKRLFIWVLESYTRQEWTLKYQLNLDAMYPVPLPNYFNDHCISRIKYCGHFAFHPEKDVLFMPMGENDFVSLDLSTGKEDKLDSLGNDKLDLSLCCWVYMPCYSSHV